MDFQMLETLLLLLLFGVPGAVFLYSYSGAFSPVERARYIQEQFPFELTVLYLAASTIIHLSLLTLLVVLLNLVSWLFGMPDIVSRLSAPLLNATSATIYSLTPSVLVLVAYFWSSLGIAYFVGKWWAQRYVPAIPLWCKELVELRAASLRNGKTPQLKLLLRDGRKLEGEWDKFSLLGGKHVAFEIAIRQAKRKQVVWIPSDNILEMDAKLADNAVKFIFSQLEREGDNSRPSRKSMERDEISTSPV